MKLAEFECQRETLRETLREMEGGGGQNSDQKKNNEPDESRRQTGSVLPLKPRANRKRRTQFSLAWVHGKKTARNLVLELAIREIQKPPKSISHP